MAYFDWAPDLVIDNGIIDADHRKLIELVNALHDATTQGRGHEIVGDIITKLMGYTHEHIRREEALMESLNYPNLDKHRSQHRNLMEKAQLIEQRFKAGQITVASQLSTLLRDWLSLHIRRSDKEIVPYLKSGASQKSASSLRKP